MEAVARIPFRLRLVQTDVALFPIFTGEGICVEDARAMARCPWRQFKASGVWPEISISLAESEANTLLKMPLATRLSSVSRASRQTVAGHAFEQLERLRKDTISFADLMLLCMYQGFAEEPLTHEGSNYARVWFQKEILVVKINYNAASKSWGMLTIDSRVLSLVALFTKDRIIHAPMKV